jgi:lysophospholipase L1-like esterase
MRIIRPAIVALILTAATLAASGFAPADDAQDAAQDDAFFLQGGETVMFFGDSITQNGAYVEYVETYLRTRFPERAFRVINHGISSETVSGTSEPDHDPRRPDAHNRFTRDVADWRPDILVACFGMNDGNYHPFGQERFAAYQAGVRRLIDRARDEAGARLVLMTPPPFDPYRRAASDPNAVSFGYKFAAVDYDDVLRRYGQWLLTLRDEGFVVADTHALMSEHLRQRRQQRVSFTLSPDAVHPDPTGHWLMAQALLTAWHAPADVATAEIDAAAIKGRTESGGDSTDDNDGAIIQGDISALVRDGDRLSFTWRTPLPLAADPRWDAESIALEQFADRFNRQRLIVRGLPAGRYRLSSADAAPATMTLATVTLATVTADELATGLDMTAYADLPSNQRAADVLARVQQRSQMIYAAWRRRIAADQSESSAEQAKIDNRAAALDEELRALCQPMEVKLVVERVE